jgi:hypothetical protein
MEIEEAEGRGVAHPWIRGKPVFVLTKFPHKEHAMHFVGVDLHKKTISVCVIVHQAGKRKLGVLRRAFVGQK